MVKQKSMKCEALATALKSAQCKVTSNLGDTKCNFTRPPHNFDRTVILFFFITVRQVSQWVDPFVPVCHKKVKYSEA